MLINLFNVPLNLLVIAVYTNIKRLGTKGALFSATSVLGGAFVAMLSLQRAIAKDDAKAAATS